MIIKVRILSLQIFIFDKFIIGIIGKIKAISTSKIKNTIAIKKNRREKGSREDLFGSNPHSNGEDFSRSLNAFFERIDASNITIIEIIKIKVIINSIELIIYIKWFKPYDWKSYILIILCK